MKSLKTLLLGVAIAAATLSSVAPADALGGYGVNRHRNAYADAYGAVKIKTGAQELRAIAPFTWAVECGAASGDCLRGVQAGNMRIPFRGCASCSSVIGDVRFVR